MGNKRGSMPQEDRAKQFMPFDAVRGLREALAEKERILVPKKELSEEKKEELDYLLKEIQPNDKVTIVYFQNDAYVKITGMVTKIDTLNRYIKIVQTEIAMDDILDMEKESYRQMGRNMI